MAAPHSKAARHGAAGRGTPQRPRRYPAYGRQLMELRMAGQVPGNSVVVAFAWNVGRIFPRIVIPDDVPPDALELRFLAGLDVMLAYQERDAARLPDLVQEILKVNPRSLLAFHMGIPKNMILKNLHGEVFA